MTLAEVIEGAGYDLRAYSGRGMYQKQCLAFECSDELGDLFANLLTAGLDAEHAVVVREMKIDTLGRGSIVYFETVPAPADLIDEDDEGSDDE